MSRTSADTLELGTVGLTVLGSLACSVALWRLGLAPWDGGRALWRLGATWHAAWTAWLTVAPAVLVIAALIGRRRPGVWAGTVLAHLCVLTAVAARFARWHTPTTLTALAVVLLVGLGTIALALRRRLTPAPDASGIETRGSAM